MVELREYLSVRRSYNLVRQETSASDRLTFEELSVLCYLESSDTPLRTSEVANAQCVLRPTMTHRSNHLAKLGLISRTEGSEDRRNVCLSITPRGRAAIESLSQSMCDKIGATQSLGRVSSDRLRYYIEAAGRVFCTAGDLVLLALENSGGPSSITELAEALGLLQPTVSMSVAGLVDQALVTRIRIGGAASRSVHVELTEKGTTVAQSLVDNVLDEVVRRQRRACATDEGSDGSLGLNSTYAYRSVSVDA